MGRLFSSAALLVLASAAAVCQTVTDLAKVRIDGRVQTVRKINGRWWSEDNRQLTPPNKGGFLWIISSDKSPGPNFHHHRPVKLEAAESLHLFMDTATVRGILGEPNESNDIGLWHYYAADGTALFVRFIRDQLTDARYEHSGWGVSGRPVRSVEKDLGGRDVFKIMADRAWQERSPAEYAKYGGTNRRALGTTTDNSIGAAPPPEPKRRIAADLIDSLKTGMTRAEVVGILGEPFGAMRIGGGDSDMDTLTYALDPQGQATIQIEKGKVTRISR